MGVTVSETLCWMADLGRVTAAAAAVLVTKRLQLTWSPSRHSDWSNWTRELDFELTTSSHKPLLGMKKGSNSGADMTRKTWWKN